MGVGEPGCGGESSVKNLLWDRGLAAGGLYLCGRAVWQNSPGTPREGLLCTSLYASGVLHMGKDPGTFATLGSLVQGWYPWPGPTAI